MFYFLIGIAIVFCTILAKYLIFNALSEHNVFEWVLSAITGPSLGVMFVMLGMIIYFFIRDFGTFILMAVLGILLGIGAFLLGKYLIQYFKAMRSERRKELKKKPELLVSSVKFEPVKRSVYELFED